MEEVNLILKCPRCNNSSTYYRSKDNSQRCKKCGFTWIIEDKKEEVKE
jgi:transposase-like protein